MKVFKCTKCNNMISYLEKDACDVKCCGETMVELVPNTTDAAGEKHVPVIEVSGNIVTVKVGSVEHPMTEEYYITWIAAEYSDSIVKYFYKPGDKPEAFFDYEEGMVVYAYCNLHGLWKKEM